jgi:hypothetical protein
VEAAPLVEEAYRADRVDELVMGDWEDFQVEVGLLDQRLSPVALNLTSDYPDGMFFGEPSGGHSREDAATKKKRKMEKASRKKNRKHKKR